jgi:hypothetical protein
VVHQMGSQVAVKEDGEGSGRLGHACALGGKGERMCGHQVDTAC